MSRFAAGFVSVWIVLALACMVATAQVGTARLEGVIQDESGAVVPGAKATVVNTRTQIGAETSSGAEGRFIFPSLQPGLYTLSVEAPGFRKAVLSNIELNVASSVAQIIKLEIGAVTESVVVEANAVRVQTTEAQIARAITLRDIDVLPQLGRAPIILAVYSPGVQIDPGDNTFSRVNGLRQGSNNSKLDGIDVNDHVVPRMGLSLTANNVDSVAEFRVVTSGGKAEYGRNAGAQIELVTRSGSNTWSGNAFDYLRNTKLNASNFFNNASVPAIPRPKFIQNLFGGSLGGPILKDRTFIFGNYQGRRTRQETVRNRTVLTPEAKQGLFRWKPPGSSEIQTFNIVANDPRKKGIDSKIAPILKMLPDPNNYDVGDGLNSAGFRFNNPSNSFEDQYTIRGDHNLWSGHRVFVRWSRQRNESIDALNNADARYPGQPHGRQGGTRWGYAIGSDWTLTSSMVNEARVGYQSASVDFWRVRLPEPMFVSNLWTDPLNPAFAQGRNSPVREFTDNVSLVRGKHTIKGGVNARFTKQWGYNDAGIYPNVTFATSFGNSVPTTIGPTGSAVISSANRQVFDQLYNDLLGRMNQVTQTFYSDLEKFQAAGTPRVRTFLFREYGYFVQDDWKVSPKLTLNLGLRWELTGVPVEKDRFQGILDKAALINTVSQISDLTLQRSNKWYSMDYNNFAPRIGLAWDPGADGKTAVRAGYGIYYDRIIGATSSLADSNTPGFSQAVPVYPNSAGTDVRVSDGIPLPQQPGAPVVRLPVTRSTSVVVFNPNLRTGYVQQYSLTIQREVYRNTVVDLGYVGTRGTKLFMDLDYNQPRIYADFLPALRELEAFRSSGTAPSATNTLVRIFGSASAAVSALGATTIQQGSVSAAASTLDRTNYTRYAAAGVSDYYLRNFPQFNQVVTGENFGRSYYNSMQLSLRRQAGALRFNANYTWSKSIDNISVDGNGFTSPMDNYNLALNRGLSDTDRTHSFNSMIIYTLPVGRGRWLAGDAPRWVDTLIGGWDLGILSIWQSGATFSFSSGRATGPSTLNTWANYTGDRKIGSVSRQGNGVFYLTPEEITRFSIANAGEIGSSGRNAFRGPRFFNLDMSLVKRFRLTEKHSINFRAEAYNLFNNVNFGQPGTSLVTLASFGKISGTVGNPRIMQMALRYDF